MPPQENTTQSPPVQVQQTTQQSSTIIYAGFWIRWAAFIVDVIIAIAPSALIAALISIPFALSSGTSLSQAFDKPPTSIIFNSTLAILVWTYFVFTTYKRGATLGKSLFKLKVVNVNGQPLSLQKTIIRELPGKIISGFVMLIGYGMVAVSKKKQALHDHLSGTVVILTKPASTPVKIAVFLSMAFILLPFVLMMVLIFTLFAFSSKNKSIKNSDQTVPGVFDYSNRLAQARDAKRKNDVSGIGTELAGFYLINKRYPLTLDEIRGSIKPSFPKPPENSEPKDDYGFTTCEYKSEPQAIVYTKLESKDAHYVYRTINKLEPREETKELPSCP